MQEREAMFMVNDGKAKVSCVGGDVMSVGWSKRKQCISTGRSYARASNSMLREKSENWPRSFEFGKHF